MEGTAWIVLWHNRESITFFFAIVGFAISVGNTIFLFYRNRRNVKIIWKSACVAERIVGHPSIFEVVVENHSARPISLSRIFLVDGEHRYEFDWIPQVCFTSHYRSGKEVVDKQVISSIQLPASLQGLAAIGGFLYVTTSDCFMEKDLKKENVRIEFWTSRGKLSAKISPAAFKIDNCANDT